MILPDYEKEEAVEFAEMIRKDIEESSFEIIPDLSEDREPTTVKMTISIGVATMPMDAKDGKELLRNADRALYIGGKQAGRNRVGVYEEEICKCNELKTGVSRFFYDLLTIFSVLVE